MTHYACPQCGATEFYRLEHLVVNSKGAVKETEDAGILKCGNCQARVEVQPDRPPTLLTQGSVVIRTPRVRTSTTAHERGMDIPQGKF